MTLWAGGMSLNIAQQYIELAIPLVEPCKESCRVAGDMRSGRGVCVIGSWWRLDFRPDKLGREESREGVAGEERWVHEGVGWGGGVIIFRCSVWFAGAAYL